MSFSALERYNFEVTIKDVGRLSSTPRLSLRLIADDLQGGGSRRITEVMEVEGRDWLPGTVEKFVSGSSKKLGQIRMLTVQFENAKDKDKLFIEEVNKVFDTHNFHNLLPPSSMVFTQVLVTSCNLGIQQRFYFNEFFTAQQPISTLCPSELLLSKIS